MSDVMKQLEELSPRKRALYEALLKEQHAKTARDGASSLPPIVPDPAHRFEPFPLTELQQAYWIGRSIAFEMGNVATHLYQEFDSAGLDVERFNLAWQRLIERHDMLRAVVLPDGQQQILAEVPPYQIAVLDLRGKSAAEVAAQLDEVRREMSHQVLQPERWPLFDLRATRLDDQRTRVHLSIDGLIADAWSMQILIREWLQFYQEPHSALAPLDLSFRDYVIAEVALRDTELYDRSLRYWRERLPHLPPAPELPFAQNPNTLTEPHFIRRSAGIEAPELQRLKAQAARIGVSLTSVLLAAYAEVLATWSKTPHFTLNVPRFNRLPMHPEVNAIMGEFASFSLLEIDHSGTASFESRAQRIQQQLWRDLDHQYVSGVHVLRELSQAHGKTSGAVMPVVFTSLPRDIGQRPSSTLLQPAEQTEQTYGITQTSQVWLDNQVVEENGVLRFNWDAVEELFPAEMLGDMFEAYCALLHDLATGNNAWKTAPQILPAAQAAQRATINNTDAPLSSELLHTLFARQARERPAQIAVQANEHALSYEALDSQTNQLARRLRELGARPNTLVAVLMEKGWEQIVAVLAVLKSGAAYLPLDADLPQERLHSLLERAETTLVLTQSGLEQRAWPATIQRLAVDTLDLGDLDDQPLTVVQQPDDLAFVIFTSGSTGQPKGAMLTHRGAVNAIVDTNERFAIGPDDRVLALTALHHDMSVFDIFGVLAAGGTVVVPEAARRRDPAHWVDLLVDNDVTVWNSVPAMIEMLLEYAAAHTLLYLPALRLAFLGGDWINVTLPERLRAVAPEARLISVGGPTETTLWNICYPVDTVDPAWKSIPYGTPLRNTRYYILSDALMPRPTWVAGQMYCAGVGVAQGYWRDPARTAARFISHPETGERIYRTGDLGRYLPDGTIEFLGREDFQVKLQGQRIELGEIEAALQQHAAVRNAVVAAVGETQTSKRLVAYVVPEHELASPSKAIGDFAAQADPQQIEASVVDQTNRIAFKLQQAGLRPIQQPTVELAHQPDDAMIAAYAARRSYRKFLAEPIELAQLGALLNCCAQIQLDGSPLPKYQYPSGGGLYPVQIYLHVKPDRVAGLAAGTYYYHPQQHSLALLTADATIENDVHVPTNLAIADEAAFSVFLIGQLDAITPMYGDLSRDLCLLEAGYMSQLLMTAAPQQQIGLCPVGSLDFERVRPLFALEESHVLLHSLFGGGIRPEQTSAAAFIQEVALVSKSTQPSGALQTEQALVGELRQVLQQKLPAHMVPSAFVVLAALPLTANGKIDRAALAQNVAANELSATPKEAYVAPQSELERLIAQVCQRVLGVERVGIYDNFFDLGGNSLHIVQVHGQLRDAIQRDVSIVEMFKNPTISALAAHLSQEQAPQPSFQNVQDRAQRQKAALGRQQFTNVRKKRDE